MKVIVRKWQVIEIEAFAPLFRVIQGFDSDELQIERIKSLEATRQ